MPIARFIPWLELKFNGCNKVDFRGITACTSVIAFGGNNTSHCVDVGG